MSEILLAGQDLRLLATRAAVLSELSSSIKWGTFRMIEPLLREEPVRLLVLCHTLPINERQELVAIAREKSPQIEVLQLVSSIELREIELLPGVKTAACDPPNLAKQVEKLLGEAGRSRPPAGRRSAVYRRTSNPDWFNGRSDDHSTFEGGLFSR